jgi:sulfur-carrier protein
VSVTVHIPRLLRDCTAGQPTVPVAGETLRAALTAMRADYPLLARHLYDERGQLRQHVLIFYNGESLSWLESLDLPTAPGDRIDILHAVSGG